MGVEEYQRAKKTSKFNSAHHFWPVQKEMNKKVFEEVDDVNDFDLIMNRWFQTAGFLLQSHCLYSIENLEDLIDTLVDM